MSCRLTCCTVSAKNDWDETSVCNFPNTFVILGSKCYFFNCSVLFKDCFQGFITVTGTVWMYYFDVEENFLEAPPESLAGDVKSRIFICISCVRGISHNFKGIRAGSISRFLHTFDSHSASRSRIALCLRMTHLPSWRVSAWSLLMSLLHSHKRGLSLIVQSYLNWLASLNSSLLKYFPCCMDGNDVSHVEVSFNCSSSQCLFVFSSAFPGTSFVEQFLDDCGMFSYFQFFVMMMGVSE